MKIAVIPEPNGYNYWQAVIPMMDQIDLCIFLGNISKVPSAIPSGTAMKQATEICGFASDPQYVGKVLIMAGPTDISYLYSNVHYSNISFREELKDPMSRLLTKHAHLFRPLFKMKNYLFSYGGLTAGWFKENMSAVIKAIPERMKESPIDEQIRSAMNQSANIRTRIFAKGTSGSQSWGVSKSFVHATHNDIFANTMPHYHQVVNSVLPCQEIYRAKRFANINDSPSTSVFFVNCWPNKKEILVIND